MKIGGRIFQQKKIIENTSDIFDAKYKKCNFYITTDHGFGEPQYKHLKRFCIDVRAEDGGYLVQTYGDFHDMRSAIIYALDGAGF